MAFDLEFITKAQGKSKPQFALHHLERLSPYENSKNSLGISNFKNTIWKGKWHLFGMWFNNWKDFNQKIDAFVAMPQMRIGIDLGGWNHRSKMFQQRSRLALKEPQTKNLGHFVS